MVPYSDLVDPSHPSFGPALLSGLLFAGAILWYAATLGYPILEFPSVAHFLAFTILLVAGTASAVALFRYRLLAPLAILAIAVYRWIGAEADPGPGDPLIGLIVVLPLYLVVMVVVGWTERRFRAAI